MAQLCTNAPPITNSAFNGSHLHQCPLTHSECTQPTQIKCSPYTLRMHSTHSNEVLSLHTQNALNQLKSSAFLTHSECTQPTQIKCSPYTLRMHSTHSNQGLSLHTQNALNQLKWRLTMLECGHMHIQCFEIPPKSTNPTLVHLQTWDGLQSFRAPAKFFKTPPRLQKRLQEPSNSANLHLQHTQTLKIPLNAHKQSNL
jgi:hypothetical protein